MDMDELKRNRDQYAKRFEEINSTQAKAQADLLKLLDRVIESPPKKKNELLAKQMRTQAWPTRRAKRLSS